MLEGKIILKYDRLGFIEYSVDSRISYMVKEYPDFNIGEKVNFEIIEKRVTGTEDTFDRAIDLIIIKENYSRLNLYRLLNRIEM